MRVSLAEHQYQQDHLVCYLPGTLPPGVHNGLPKKYRTIAKSLLYTWCQVYKQMPTRLSLEIVHFNITKGAQSDILSRYIVNSLR